MPKRKQPHRPEVPWQTTPAQEAGTETANVAKDGRVILRRHRYQLFEAMSRHRTEGEKRIHPELTKRQYIAAEKLHEAWCRTQQSPSKSGEFVDTTPDWGAVALGAAIRAFELADLTACLPRSAHGPTMALIEKQVHPGDKLDDVRRGLDMIADYLRIK